MHSAVAIANAFIARSIADRTRSLSPTKLHELVYLAHGWNLALTAQPLITGSVVAYRDGVMAALGPGFTASFLQLAAAGAA